MSEGTDVTRAGREYAAAYAAHYATKDLRGALALYKAIMASHPGSPEASYSRSQIQNIARSVVPEQELFDAQADLAEAHFEGERQPD